MKPELVRFLEGRGVRLSQDQIKMLDGYKSLVLDASTRLNLLSSGDLGRLEELHFADSLAPVRLIPEGATVADWGSGAGLPGIPLAIARPDILVTLVESRKRKASFLVRVKRELGLANVTSFPDRGEKLSDTFDIITVRAIGSVKELLPEFMEHLQEKGGALFYKGPGLDEELREAERIIQGYELKSYIERVSLPQGEERRYLLFSRR